MSGQPHPKGMITPRFQKFYNIGEQHTVFPDEPVTAVTKLDGALGISYIWNGVVRWATRGSFDSPAARAAERIWADRYASIHPSDIGPYTLLVEILSPETEGAIPHPIEDLVLIGVISLADGYDLHPEEVDAIARRLGMTTPPRMVTTLADLLHQKTILPANQEGWVLRFDNGERYKLKGDAYLREVAKRSRITPMRTAYHWCRHKEESWINDTPEEFHPFIRRLFRRLSDWEQDVWQEGTTWFEEACRTRTTNKEKERFIQTRVPALFRPVCFSLLRGGKRSIRSSLWREGSEIKRLVHGENRKNICDETR